MMLLGILFSIKLLAQTTLFNIILNFQFYISVALSCSRYWAIVQPFRTQPSMFAAKLIISVIWTSSVLLVIPFMLGLQYVEESKSCEEVWSTALRQMYGLALLSASLARRNSRGDSVERKNAARASTVENWSTPLRGPKEVGARWLFLLTFFFFFYKKSFSKAMQNRL